MSVAKPSPHDSGPTHVTGQARYTDDIPLPANTLHLAFGLSEKASATVTNLDLLEVLAAPGVVTVLTAKDLPAANDVSPSVHDEPLLANGTVHYIGQPIFLVVATSHLAARKAARLAKIDYSEHAAIVSIEDAIRAKSHFEEPVIWTNGDAHLKLQEAKHRVQGSLEIGGQEHFYLEGQAAVALPGENGDMLIHSSTQHPTEIQHKVADALGQHMNSVRVEVRRMGGGFGGKESQGNALAVACAVATRMTGCPAKMRYDRDDDMMITGKRHDFRVDYDVGFDDTGRILGLNFEQFARCGWAQDLSLAIADRAMLHADNAYDLPDISITSHRLKTNTQSATAFRGFGGPQGMVAMERVIDVIAARLGIDPLDVRRANFYGAGKANITPYQMQVEDSIISELASKLADDADYKSRRAEIMDWNKQSSVIKRGIALTPVKFGISFTLTHLNQAGALVHIYNDGSIHLNHGGTEMGQGLFTKVAQVAATAFDLPLDAIKITATDTAKVPNTSATAASSGSDINGMATKAACDTLRERLVAHASATWGKKPSEIHFEAGKVRIGTQSIPFAALVKSAYEARVQLSATGFYSTPKIEWDRVNGRGRPFFYFAYGAAVTEVALDTLTGENRILRTDILHDVGHSLNPAIDIGQIEGGFVQGAGWLTTEELIWDTEGRLRTHAPSTYKIPACSDRPREFNVALWDGKNREETIYRSKAVGEPPLMLGISVHSALTHAVSQSGPKADLPDLDAPATAERLLQAVNRHRGVQ